MSENPIKVLVTGVGGRSVGYGIMFALKDSGSRYRIIATDSDPFSFGLYEASEGYVVPRASAPDYCDMINEIAAINNVQGIFPGTIPELETLSDQKEKINKPLVMNLNSKLIDISKDKLLVYEHLKKLGIHTPETVPSERVDELISTKGFPLIIKPRFGTGASRNVIINIDTNESGNISA